MKIISYLHLFINKFIVRRTLSYGTEQTCGNTFTLDSAATKTPTFRKLEDLNLIDNFLFQEMLTQKEDGEKFARILLKTILGKPIRNVFIIFILPYDPFDKNRMVYTVQNRCIEDNTIPYDDGARKIFLYTKGYEGNPRQELKDILKYIEKYTAENITNQDIASVSELVTKVKQRREVGIN